MPHVGYTEAKPHIGKDTRNRKSALVARSSNQNKELISARMVNGSQLSMAKPESAENNGNGRGRTMNGMRTALWTR